MIPLLLHSEQELKDDMAQIQPEEGDNVERRKDGNGEEEEFPPHDERQRGVSEVRHVGVLDERGEVEGVADPEADPIRSGYDGREDELGDVELEEEGEERVGVDVEGVGPAVKKEGREGKVRACQF